MEVDMLEMTMHELLMTMHSMLMSRCRVWHSLQRCRLWVEERCIVDHRSGLEVARENPNRSDYLLFHQ